MVGAGPPRLPARRVRPRQPVEVRATKSQVALHSAVPDASGQTLLAVHPRAVSRGARVVDETHWDGLPTGAGRRVTTGDALPTPRRSQPVGPQSGRPAAVVAPRRTRVLPDAGLAGRGRRRTTRALPGRRPGPAARGPRSHRGRTGPSAAADPDGGPPDAGPPGRRLRRTRVPLVGRRPGRTRSPPLPAADHPFGGCRPGRRAAVRGTPGRSPLGGIPGG